VQGGSTLSDHLRQVQADTETKLAAVFTPEQMKTYRAGLAAKAGGSSAKP
jgi:hypothetical protein